MKSIFKRPVTTIFALQTFHILRFVTFLIISIIFVKSNLSAREIGDFELLLFIASIVSFFWMTGLIQSFLPLYNNNAVFPGEKIDREHRSPEIFNAFLLISAFSLLIFALGWMLKGSFMVYNQIESIPHVRLLLWYILLSNPAHFVEYIYLLRNRPERLLAYGIVTHVLQLLVVAGPVLAGYGVTEALWGLLAITSVRFVWLLALVRKYGEIRVSWPFMKAHLHLGYPLIISTLLSGSAQYIDGFVVANRFDSQAFAIFRFGAKELPFVVLLAAGLHSALLPEFTDGADINAIMRKIKDKTRKLIHVLFPLSTLFLFFSDLIFPAMFSGEYIRSSDVFMIYILLITSRLIFPQTILIGLKKTRVVMVASIGGIILNLGLSFWLQAYYGLAGVAVATVIVMALEKLGLILYNYIACGIGPDRYTPILPYLIHSVILIAMFVLIDHRIINIF